MIPYREKIQAGVPSLPVRVLTSISEARQNRYIQVHPHWHEEIEILYYLKGHARQQVGSTIIDATEGDIIIIGSNEIHATYTDLRDSTVINVLQFNPGMLSPYNSRYPERLNPDSKCRYINYPIPVHTDNDQGKKIAQYIMDIFYEFAQKSDGYEYYIKSHIYMLTGILERTFGCREFYPGQYKAGNRYREMLKEVFKYIDQYYYNNITLKSAAEIANLSIAHFCRLFKASTGMTFKDYLALYRVNKAEELLYTSASITEICFSCGFNSMTSFNRAFKQFKHCTPSSYRNNL